MVELPGIKDDRGLLGSVISMTAGARASAPDPRMGDGQYLLVVKGSLRHENREHKPYTIVFVESHEAPFELVAGNEGLEALIMNFPKPGACEISTAAKAPTQGYKKWQCELCAFAYDEVAGMPDDGIAPGTRWADVPETWSCPDCSAVKSDFRMVEVS